MLTIVSLNNVVEVRAAEEVKHCKVLLAMATVSSRVDQNRFNATGSRSRTSRSPHEIATPQIPMNARRRVQTSFSQQLGQVIAHLLGHFEVVLI